MGTAGANFTPTGNGRNANQQRRQPGWDNCVVYVDQIIAKESAAAIYTDLSFSSLLTVNALVHYNASSR